MDLVNRAPGFFIARYADLKNKFGEQVMLHFMKAVPTATCFGCI